MIIIRDYIDYMVLFLVWLISATLIRSLVKKLLSPPSPPSPLALPIIGHLHLLAPIPHQALAKLASKHGPLINIYIGSVPFLVASSPETAKEVLKTNESSFLDRPQTLATDYLSYGSNDFSFAPYGPFWKFMKKLCMSQLLGGQTLDLLEPIREDERNNLLRVLHEKAKVRVYFDIGSELMRMTNNLISRMLMSERCSGDENESGESIKKLIQEVAEVTGKFNVSDYIWFCKNLDLQGFGKRLKEIRDRFDELMGRIIDEHESKRSKVQLKGGAVKDLLDILLDISEDKNSDLKLTKENIKAFILDIFVAGTDTSAITIQWALSELINHPTILQKLIEEISSITSNNERLIQESDIPNLPYLQAIVKETLRLHPPGPLILRQSNEDCTIDGYKIPSKTRLFVNVWAIGRDTKYWENALEFIPERFMIEKKDMDVRGQHYEYLPFGSGRRGCPGTTLALKVIETTLGAMVQCFDWKVEGECVNMEEGIGITLPRAHPLICLPVPRVNPTLFM